MANLNKKLTKIERYLNVFDDSDNLINEILIPSTQKLEEFISSIGEEFEMYDGYELNEEQMQYVNHLLETPIPIDIEKQSYHIVTLGIYDWNK